MNYRWQQLDAEFRREWTGHPVDEIEPHAQKMVDRLSPGVSSELARAYAISVSEGRPFGLE